MNLDIYPSRTSSVNKVLKAAGIPNMLYRGNGYFYFSDTNWYTSSVMVYRLDAYTIRGWLEIYIDMADDYHDPNGEKLRRYLKQHAPVASVESQLIARIQASNVYSQT